MNMNRKDPLLKTGPERQLELFKEFSKSAHGYSAEDAIGAAGNVIVTALRQTHATREKASEQFDEWFGKLKTILMGHYTSAGRLKGVFPYDQVISAPLIVSQGRIFTPGSQP
jgi:hypothetical protein